jgi:hypothetical protein
LTSAVKNPRRWVAPALATIAILVVIVPFVAASKKLPGIWSFAITIPEGPNSATTRTFTVTLNVSPRVDSLHGRATITDEAARTVSGAWRQAGKRISVAYELPCPGDGPCASLILLGKVKDGGAVIKNGTVVVVWDTPNDRDPSSYDTSNGSFRGDRLQ